MTTDRRRFFGANGRMRYRAGIVGPFVKLVIFLVVTTFVAYVLAETISPSEGGSARTYHAVFTDIQGVNAGDDVRIAGVQVGSIQSMRHYGGGNSNLAELTFTVQSDHRLPTSVQAVLKFRNLVGQRYLALEEGAGDPNKFLKPGATIHQNNTAPALDLTKLLGGFAPLYQVLDPAEVNELSGSLIQVLQGEGGSIELLVQQLGSVLAAIADKSGVIEKLITDLATVLTAIGKQDANLSTLITSLQAWITGLAANKGTIQTALTSVSGLANSLTDLLVKARPPLAADIKQLGRVAGTLNANGSLLTSTVQNLPGQVAMLARPATYGGWLNFFICSIRAPVKILSVADHGASSSARCQ